MDIRFESIDVDAHFSYCVAFRRDAYFCSFETYTGYEDSITGYRERMSHRVDEGDWYYFHLWCENEIIGQLEFKSFSEIAEMGYVHLIYIIPQYRGLGVAELAQDVIVHTLISRGCTHAMLSVSRTNKRAIKHYKRFGWAYLKPNPKHEVTDFYVRELRL